MNPMDAQAAAKQIVSKAQAQPIGNGPAPTPGASPMPPTPPTPPMNQPGLPVPPPHVALQLAQQAPQMPPIVLGTLMWRGLQQHGAATGNLTHHFGGQVPMPMGQPMGGGQ